MSEPDPLPAEQTRAATDFDLESDFDLDDDLAADDLDLDLDLEKDFDVPVTISAQPAADTPVAPAAEQAADLRIGDWVRFSDADKAVHCKLVARIDREDRYVFVNDFGKRQRELSGPELKALRASGQCERLAATSRFEETVANMVRSFREPGSSGEES